MIFLQIEAIGTRLIVVAVYPGTADELDQILIAMIVLGKDDEVIAGSVSRRLVPVLLTVVGDIHLTAEDRFERLLPFSLALLVDGCAIVGELLDTIHDTMIRDGHAFHPVFNSLVNEVGHLRLSVKNTIMCMNV